MVKSSGSTGFSDLSSDIDMSNRDNELLVVWVASGSYGDIMVVSVDVAGNTRLLEHFTINLVQERPCDARRMSSLSSLT
jgi:hypothetical protein